MVTKEDGYLGSLTPIQEKALKLFKEEVKKENTKAWKYDVSQFDDYDYLRFLRARKFDLKNTFEMFAKYIKWRVEYGADKIFVMN